LRRDEIREGTVFSVVPVSDIEGAWAEVVGNRVVRSCAVVQYGPAEEVVAFFSFADGTFEVGIGEALRPYLQMYEGRDAFKATEVFLRVAYEHSFG
jgi:hypothetical protein